jgi:hypothetical protein
VNEWIKYKNSNNRTGEGNEKRKWKGKKNYSLQVVIKIHP